MRTIKQFFIFRKDLKTKMQGAHLILNSNWFHHHGAATVKALSPFSFSRDCGTKKRDLLSDVLPER